MAMRAPLLRNKLRRTLARSQAVVAPVEGWDASSALANMPAKRAVQLKNWFPKPDTIEVRKGYDSHATHVGSDPKTISAIDTGTETFTSNSHGKANAAAVRFHATTTLPGGISAATTYYVINTATNTFQVSATVGGSAVNVTSSGSGTITVYSVDSPPIETLAVWQGPTSSKMFAAAGGAIWDVTAEDASTFSYTPGGGSDRWQSWMHTTSAGHYLFMVNGTDAPIHYNGTTWTAPTITGITASDIISGITHKKRIWFVMSGSTKAAYLGTEAVAGAATEFQFGSLFTRGGYLLALATWTRDGGSGADDYLVAVSSRGQVAIYQGTDPASADTWSLVGVFDVPTPIGRRCFTRYGADVLLITVQGVFPLSQLLSVDQSQAGRVSITERISQAFNTAAVSYQDFFGWEACVYPRGTRLIINIPTAESETAKQYVMNTLTGAWCEYDSHNAVCWTIYNDDVFFGGPDGTVYQADTGSTDLDQPITATGQSAYSALGSAGLKRFSMVKSLIVASGGNRPALGLSVDFVETQEMSTITAVGADGVALWDEAEWDADVWSGGEVQYNDWATLPALGTFGSIKFRAQTGVDATDASVDETMKIQGFVVLYEMGGYV